MSRSDFRRILGATAVLLIALAPAAFAAGFNVAWNDCAGSGGVAAKVFACDTNTGTEDLVVSVRAPAGISRWVSFECELFFRMSVEPVPPWWQLRNQSGQSSQCRNGALSVLPVPPPGSTCTDAYLGQGAGGIGTYQIAPSGKSNQARLLTVFAVPMGTESVLQAGEEYFVQRVVVTHAKSAGSGACASCNLPVCAFVSFVRVVQVNGAPGGNVEVSTAAESPSAAWQEGSDFCRQSNAARKSSWGAVKSIYR